MLFQVPQFIEVEDKIFGPLTLKQFFYLAAGAAAIFVVYAFLPLLLTIIIAPPIGLFAAALAFYKINNQPFIKVVENALMHYLKGRIYTWKKREPEKSKEKAREAKTQADQSAIYVPKLTKSKLEDLAWSLEIRHKDKQQHF
jgi:hypothetical protein